MYEGEGRSNIPHSIGWGMGSAHGTKVNYNRFM
jgi:hypothetical protein